MGAQDLLQQAWNLFYDVEYSQVEGILAQIDGSLSRSERRQIGHLRAKLALVKNDIDAAQKILFDAYMENGPHIGLLCDLATCLYYQKDWSRLRSYLKKIAAELSDAQTLISVENTAATIELLAKFHEELGDLAEALKLMNEMDVSDLSPGLRGSFLSNKLRLHCEVGLHNNIKPLYSELLLFSKSFPRYHFAGVQHALMWAEAELFGVQQALARYHMSQESHLELDKSLFAYDLLDIHMTKEEKISLALPPPPSSYESMLVKIHQGSWSLDEIKTLASELSPGQFFKLLLHCQNHAEAAQLFEVSLSQLSGASRKLWKTRARAAQVGAHIDVLFDRSSLQIGKIKLDLRRKQNHLLILQAFLNNSQMGTEELCTQLGSRFYDDSQKNRARMAILRINQEFLKASGYKLIEMQGDTFALNEVFKLSNTSGDKID